MGWLRYGDEDGEFEFVGDVSPARRPETAAAATVRMALRGQRLCQPRWIIVDTTGYVDGPGASRLKTAKIQLLAPATVIAIGPAGRLDHLRWPWRGRAEVRWLRMDVAPACKQKTVEQRRQWRRDLFARWLDGAQEHEFELDHLALQHFPPRSVLEEMAAGGRLRGLLAGLDDDRGVGICLGLVEELDMARTYVRIWAPSAAREARGLRLGALRLNRDGTPIDGGES